MSCPLGCLNCSANLISSCTACNSQDYQLKNQVCSPIPTSLLSLLDIDLSFQIIFVSLISILIICCLLRKRVEVAVHAYDICQFLYLTKFIPYGSINRRSIHALSFRSVFPWHQGWNIFTEDPYGDGFFAIQQGIFNKSLRIVCIWGFCWTILLLVYLVKKLSGVSCQFLQFLSKNYLNVTMIAFYFSSLDISLLYSQALFFFTQPNSASVIVYLVLGIVMVIISCILFCLGFYVINLRKWNQISKFNQYQNMFMYGLDFDVFENMSKSPLIQGYPQEQKMYYKSNTKMYFLLSKHLIPPFFIYLFTNQFYTLLTLIPLYMVFIIPYLILFPFLISQQLVHIISFALIDIIGFAFIINRSLIDNQIVDYICLGTLGGLWCFGIVIGWVMEKYCVIDPKYYSNSNQIIKIVDREAQNKYKSQFQKFKMQNDDLKERQLQRKRQQQQFQKSLRQKNQKQKQQLLDKFEMQMRQAQKERLNKIKQLQQLKLKNNQPKQQLNIQSDHQDYILDRNPKSRLKPKKISTLAFSTNLDQ